MSGFNMKRHRRRQLKHSFSVRDKKRPLDQDNFNVEVRLRPIVDVIVIQKRPHTPVNNMDQEFYSEWIATMITIREMIGGRYKVIHHRYRGKINTKILLEREPDLLMLVLAHSGMVHKAYRYV
jgi:hypothetical protein